MPDRIELRGLRVMATHGVLPFEKERAQPFEIDIDIEVDLRAAGTSDRLGETVSYGEAARLIEQVVKEERNDLLERVAERVASALLALNGVIATELVVRKLRPPVPVDLGSAAVRIRRP